MSRKEHSPPWMIHSCRLLSEQGSTEITNWLLVHKLSGEQKYFSPSKSLHGKQEPAEPLAAVSWVTHLQELEPIRDEQ